MPVEGTGLPIVGAEIAGKYRIESILGQGGMGAVFAARNVMTGKRVAIKWLLPEHAASNTRDRLVREAQCAASIDHPNVVDIYDVGEHQGGLFLVMEYLRGKPLSEVLAERGRLDPEELIALLVPVMRGVHAAHLAGVIHRDLKPENIILSESDGQIVPKVVDFGVSKNIGASALPNSSLTRTGALVGTPHYMALEQVDGSNAIDGRTDVYAFGVLLYRSLTGAFPFDGTSLGEVILKIGTKDPPPMRLIRPELPAGLDTLVLRALSRDRNKRFHDLEELARGLVPFSGRSHDSVDTSLPPGAVQFRSFGSSGGERSTREGISARATPPIELLARRKRTMLLSAVAAMSLLLAGVWLYRRESAASVPLAGKAQTVQPSAELTAPAAAAVAEPGTGVPARSALAEPPTAAQATSVLAGANAVVNGKDEPADALTPEPMLPAPASAETAVERPASQHTRAPAAPLTRAEKRAAAGERNKARTSANANRKSNGSGLVPGERTNGFSVDEF